MAMQAKPLLLLPTTTPSPLLLLRAEMAILSFLNDADQNHGGYYICISLMRVFYTDKDMMMMVGVEGDG